MSNGAHVIGVVGGMGPQAGVDLVNCIIKNTQAGTDQQHLSTILMSFPGSVPDRTAFLENSMLVNPAYAIADIIKKLENMGANIVAIACNTAYAPPIYDVVMAELRRFGSRINLINMPGETCDWLTTQQTSVQRVGLMTTNGTYKSEIYKRHLLRRGHIPIVPDFDFQDKVIHKMIYDPVIGIKANAGGITKEARMLFHTACEFFREQNADAVILGCTELSIMVNERAIQDMIIVNSTDVVAKALIREAASYKKNRAWALAIDY